jgi:hypothetical protein
LFGEIYSYYSTVFHYMNILNFIYSILMSFVSDCLLKNVATHIPAHVFC